MKLVIRRDIYTRPAKIMFGYIMIMPILYMYSIFDVTCRSPFLFWLFLVLANTAAYAGFIFGVKKIGYSQTLVKKEFDVYKLINYLFWAALIISIPKYMLYTGDHSFNIVDRFLQLLNGNVTFLESYNARQSIVATSGIWRLINFFVIFTSPLHWCYIPLSLYCWKSLTPTKKTGSLFIYFLYVFQYLSSGASVGMVYLFIFIASTWLYKDAIQTENNRFSNRMKQLDRKKKMHLIALIVLIVVIILAFGAIMLDRGSGYEKRTITIGTEVLFPNDNSLIWRLTPKFLKSTLINVYAYLLKAYAALDMALSISGSIKMPRCYGAGNSWFFADNVKQLFGYDVIAQTYNMRLHELFGYNYYTQWHTVYVWFANDVTFFGVPVILFLIMALWGSAWRDYLNNHNVFAFLLMVIFFEFVVFMPMNNQVFQHSETLFSFWGLIICWLVSHRQFSFNFK